MSDRNDSVPLAHAAIRLSILQKKYSSVPHAERNEEESAGAKWTFFFTNIRTGEGHLDR